jgi:hypothetical protein
MPTILQTTGVRQQRGGINRITTSVTPEMLTGTTGQLMLNTFKNTADGTVKLLNQLQDNEDLDKISRGQALWDEVTNQGTDIYKSELGINAYGAKGRAAEFYDTKGLPDGVQASEEAQVFNKTYDEMSQYQKQAVDKYIRGRRAPFVGGIADHEITQRTASAKAGNELRVEQSINKAALYFNTDSIIMEEVAKIHALHREIGPAAGLDARGIAFATAKDTTRLHQGVIKRRIAELDSEGAQNYLDMLVEANALLPSQFASMQSLVNASVRANVKATNEQRTSDERELEDQQDATFLMLSGMMQKGTLNYDTLQSFAENESIDVPDFKHFERLLKSEEDAPQKTDPKVYRDMRLRILEPENSPEKTRPGYAEIYRNKSLTLADQDKLATMIKKIGDDRAKDTKTGKTDAIKESMTRARRIMNSSFGFKLDNLDEGARAKKAAAEHEWDVEVFEKGRNPVEVANELATAALGAEAEPGGPMSKAKIRIEMRNLKNVLPKANLILDDKGSPDIDAMRASIKADIANGNIKKKDVGEINMALQKIEDNLPPPPPPKKEEPVKKVEKPNLFERMFDKGIAALRPDGEGAEAAEGEEGEELTLPPEGAEGEGAVVAEDGEEDKGWAETIQSAMREGWGNASDFAGALKDGFINPTNNLDEVRKGIQEYREVQAAEEELARLQEIKKEPAPGAVQALEELQPEEAAAGEGETLEGSPPLDNEENILNATDAIVRKVVDVNPRLINSLIRIESNFNPSAVSDKGATGLLQIMPGTADGIAKATGLDRDKILTDPATNIEAGTWLFYEDIMPRYADVNDDDQFKFALAEWNSSPKVIKAARKKAKDSKNFEDIYDFLPEETREFMFKISKAIGRTFEIEGDI